MFFPDFETISVTKKSKHMYDIFFFKNFMYLCNSLTVRLILWFTGFLIATCYPFKCLNVMQVTEFVPCNITNHFFLKLVALDRLYDGGLIFVLLTIFPLNFRCAIGIIPYWFKLQINFSTLKRRRKMHQTKSLRFLELIKNYFVNWELIFPLFPWVNSYDILLSVFVGRLALTFYIINFFTKTTKPIVYFWCEASLNFEINGCTTPGVPQVGQICKQIKHFKNLLYFHTSEKKLYAL